MMKVKAKNNPEKFYEYNYKTLFLKEDVHERLKEVSRKENLSMSKLIDKLINEKTCSCPNG